MLSAEKEAALSDHVIEWGGKPVVSIKRGFAAAVASAGLEGVTPHVLRHTAAVHMAKAGVSMDEIAQYLGHSDTRITSNTYARCSPEHLQKAATALEFGFAASVENLLRFTEPKRPILFMARH